ncbi:hypothetical protein BJX76DRAFT_338566 [Aspergillus varians]
MAMPPLKAAIPTQNPNISLFSQATIVIFPTPNSFTTAKIIATHPITQLSFFPFPISPPRNLPCFLLPRSGLARFKYSLILSSLSRPSLHGALVSSRNFSRGICRTISLLCTEIDAVHADVESKVSELSIYLRRRTSAQGLRAGGPQELLERRPGVPGDT